MSPAGRNILLEGFLDDRRQTSRKVGDFEFEISNSESPDLIHGGQAP